MFLALAIVFAIIWTVALLTMEVAGFAVHILIILAVVSFVAHILGVAL